MFNKAREAYAAHDYVGAIVLFEEVLEAGETSGEVHHLKGNAFMQIGRFDDAAEAYRKALADGSYGKRGAVSTNLGKAYMAIGDVDSAVESFHAAISDRGYEAVHKAYSALGGAYLKKNKPREAGVAYRKAALDERNPDPSRALLNLGLCFMELDRPQDAIEAYRTALDFAMPSVEQRMIHANMGQAYVALNRMDEAYESFMNAIEGGMYELTPAAQRDFETAKEVRNAQKRAASSLGGTEEFLMSAGARMSDTGSAVIMPSPEDSGFFDLSEKELIAQSKMMSKAERKNKHTGLKVFFGFLIVLLLAAVGLFYAYTQGFGYPMQETTINNLFNAHARGADTTEYWGEGATAEYITEELREVAPTSNITIDGMDSSSTTSTARVTATLPEGGTVTYKVDLVRDMIAWKVGNIDLMFDSRVNAPADGPQALGGADNADPLAGEGEQDRLEVEQQEQTAPAN